MQKVEGVQAVKVSLTDGVTTLDLKSGNTITMAKLRQVIKNNGFVPKEARVVGRGAPSGTAMDPRFVLSGTNEDLALLSPPARVGEDWQLVVRAPAKP